VAKKVQNVRQKRLKRLRAKASEIRRRYSIRRRVLKSGREFYQNFEWRDSPDPFHGLIAEVLLQRTTAKAAHRVYPNFVDQFPNPATLADATEEKVLEVIHSLGIYSRARSLISLSKELIEKHRGEVPNDYTALIQLPGIGKYAASAYLCLHRNQPIAIADSNVQRVAGRLIGESVSVEDGAMFLEWILPKDNPRAFTLAILDFSMKICRPNPWTPRCSECPFISVCKTGTTILNGVSPKWL
jgi:A/G-specific adenine glycosylase